MLPEADNLDQRLSSLAGRLRVRRLGLVAYREAWEMQRSLQRALIEGCGEQTLLLCQHLPVITRGKGGKPENITAPAELLESRGIEVLEVERGGDVTYHGPGQLVGYPILNLNTLRRDVGWYMRSLEAVVIAVLEQYGLPGERIPGKTGVWIRQTPSGNGEFEKISSLGVRISRWCTMHGFSLNVRNCSQGFSLINPCGFQGIRTTSLEDELIGRGSSLSENLPQVETRVISAFLKTFAMRELD